MYYLVTINLQTDKVTVWHQTDNKALADEFSGQYEIMTATELAEEDWQYA